MVFIIVRDDIVRDKMTYYSLGIRILFTKNIFRLFIPELSIIPSLPFLRILRREDEDLFRYLFYYYIHFH